MQTIYLLLYNIRSTHNVGSIFRTADAAGIKKMFLCGITPDPVDRFGRDRSDISKVALGAEKTVSWIHVEHIEDSIQSLKKDGVKVVAIEQHKNSIPHNTFKHSGPVAFVVGEETKGIPEDILRLCDEIIEIPMQGKKESLNVSVATGVVLFRYIEQLS